MARRDSSDPWGNGQTLNWAWAWPANRRILYNRASADTAGNPFNPKRKQVWWNGTAWIGSDVPDFKVDSPPADGMGPFIMNPEGVARFFAVDKMAEGPFPEHYEPFETPITVNPMNTNPKAVSNPAARVFKGDMEQFGTAKDFPYAIRVSSEVMESNGSTSMATVCAGTLSLLDAGVPLKRPVAGISVGLVTEYDGETLKRYTTLTDIIGSEDHFGDMDFKLCGTELGVTGFQLDLKLAGVSHEIMREAVAEATEARTKILGVMAGILSGHRTEMSPYAPRIETIRINPDKIGLIIGPGGKTIKGIVAETGAEINIEDDGSVHIYSNNGDSLKRAKEIINGMTKEISIGEVYQGTVVSIKEFGAFVEVLPGKDGLVHISELADFRVNRVEDVVKNGDSVWVKCIGVDDKGRVKLSRKAAMKERDEAATAQA